MSTLTDSERADYIMLGSAKAIIEWLVDDRSDRAIAAAREWLEQYDERIREALSL